MSDDMLYGSEDTNGVGLELRIEQGIISPKEIWNQREQLKEATRVSREEVWDKMLSNDEERDAIVQMVKGALERLHDRAAEWVPEGLSAEGGEFIDVNFRILMTDISKEILRNEMATEMSVKSAIDDSKGMLDV